MCVGVCVYVCVCVREREREREIGSYLPECRVCVCVCILTPGRPVPVQTVYRQAPGRVATGSASFEATGMT